MDAAFTPHDFRQAQHELGLSDRQFAFVLGQNDQQIRRMKVLDTTLPSHRPVSPTAARLLRAYLDGYRPIDWPS